MSQSDPDSRDPGGRLDNAPPVRVSRQSEWHFTPTVPRRSGLWNNLAFWRTWSLLATLAALILGGHLGLLLLYKIPRNYIALISDGVEQPTWLLRTDPEKQRLKVLTLRPQEPTADRSFQLWLLPDEREAPRSLGLIPPQGSVSLKLSPELIRLLPGAIGFSVSLEPPGGSPTGQPTGPMLYEGMPVPPA